MDQKQFKILTWETLKQSIKDLPKPKNWHNVSNVQKMHTRHLQKLAVLNELISKIAATDDVGDHIEVACESLENLHKGKPKDQNFLFLQNFTKNILE